uniref:RING-type domain-containing protein n=1 Tax=viral metagenome TaxID=1070528 RepID=A0A6C0LTF5_9ZZZZ
MKEPKDKTMRYNPFHGILSNNYKAFGECPICLDEMDGRQVIAPYECGNHFIHSGCFTVKSPCAKNCSLCRSPLTTNASSSSRIEAFVLDEHHIISKWTDLIHLEENKAPSLDAAQRSIIQYHMAHKLKLDLEQRDLVNKVRRKKSINIFSCFRDI